ncbi:MAG: hypothetical protein K2Q21_01855 [Chitinophagaceae bacterium]|nr:hypothetical protein [Chitinophagaceae bacterium]
MDLEQLNFLPEWDENRFIKRMNRHGEAWKNAPGILAARDVYKQWRELFGLVIAFAENLEDERDENNQSTTKSLIYQNAMIVAPKIIGAVSVDAFSIKMENAALIRSNCRQMMEQINFSVLMGWSDETYKQVIEESLEQFKYLFRIWVATFERNGDVDEWGLFL